MTSQLWSCWTLAEVGLEEVDGEAYAHYQPEHPDALGYYEGRHAYGYAPHEDFAGEPAPSRQLGLAPPEGMRGRSEGQRRGTALK